MSDPKLRQRLRRLGLKPARELAKSNSPSRAQRERGLGGGGRVLPEFENLPEEPPQSIEALVPGQVVETQWGSFYLIEQRYPLTHRHGGAPLREFLERNPRTAAEVARDAGLSNVALDSLAFVDAETTGLGGGAGTFAFLVGVGTFDDDAFRLRQYFLRDPAEEPAMLGAFAENHDTLGGWVTFNGKAFDLPLIESRYRLSHRSRLELLDHPHLDLLFPARRLFRGRLPSCSLGDIEAHVFAVEREDADVPGFLIPQLYLDYLRTGDGHGMRRVLYHNAMDVLSMVILAAHLLDVFSRPVDCIHSADDHLALAQWHEVAGRPAEAEASYRAALRGHLKPEDQIKARTRLAALLKRAGRRAEAVEHWESLFALVPREVAPCVELAKYYEWEAADYASAIGWTKVAIQAAGRLPAGWQKDEMIMELRHRLRRLERKKK